MSQRANNLITGDTFSIPDDLAVAWLWGKEAVEVEDGEGGIEIKPWDYGVHTRFLGLDAAPGTKWSEETTEQVEKDYPEISVEQAMTLMYKNLHMEYGSTANPDIGQGINGLPLFTKAHARNNDGEKTLVVYNRPFGRDESYDIPTTYTGPDADPSAYEGNGFSAGIMEQPWQRLVVADALDVKGTDKNPPEDTTYGGLVKIWILRNPKNDKVYLGAHASAGSITPGEGNEFSTSVAGQTFSPSEPPDGYTQVGNLTVTIPTPTPKDYLFPMYAPESEDNPPGSVDAWFKTKDARIGNENW